MNAFHSLFYQSGPEKSTCHIATADMFAFIVELMNTNMEDQVVYIPQTYDNLDSPLPNRWKEVNTVFLDVKTVLEARLSRPQERSISYSKVTHGHQMLKAESWTLEDTSTMVVCMSASRQAHRPHCVDLQPSTPKSLNSYSEERQWEKTKLPPIISPHWLDARPKSCKDER
jgi:hypothetical protein